MELFTPDFSLLFWLLLPILGIVFIVFILLFVVFKLFKRKWHYHQGHPIGCPFYLSA